MGKEISTRDSLASIRQYLPGAEIILSTWKGASVAGLDYDVLVESEDPGPQKRPDGLPFNINRQIVSTRAGLNQASRPMAVKMRSDIKFTNSNILSIQERRRCPSALRLFVEPLASAELYSRDPACLDCVHLFHPSDFFFFGLTRDLRDLWDIPLHGDNLVTKSWENWQFTSEQYIWISFLRKRGIRVAWKHMDQFSFRLVWISERSLMSNLAILNCDQLGLKFATPNSGVWKPHTVYTNAAWQKLARIHDSLFLSAFYIFRLWLSHVPRRLIRLKGTFTLHARHYFIRILSKIKKTLALTLKTRGGQTSAKK